MIKEKWQGGRRGHTHAAEKALESLKSRLNGIDTTLGKRKDRGT